MTPRYGSDRRSVDAARNSRKLAIVFSVLGVMLIALSWPGVRIAFGVAGFFLIISVIESLSLRHRQRGAEVTVAAAALPAPGEFSAFLLRGERAFGTTVVLSGRVVPLDLSEDELVEERRRVALDLIARSSELSANFESFKRAQSARNARYSEPILGLQIEWISFHDTDPQSGEVYFTKESGEDIWFCGLQGMAFDGLIMES